MSRIARIPFLLPALLVALVFTAVPVVRYALIPTSARTAAAALRSSSVYVAPGQSAVLDADRVRKVLGDRPILVAVLSPSYPHSVLQACTDIAKVQTTSIVLTYLGRHHGDYPAICASDSFPEPHVPGLHAVEGISVTDFWLEGGWGA